MPLPRRRNNTSFVLVVVLGMLVLIIILVVGFLGHVSSQTKSSTSYRDQTGTLLLSDEAVNLVKAQIDAAIAGSSGTGTQTTLWASQPGAIRSVNFTGTNTYKLYSSANLVSTLSGSSLGAEIAADLPGTTATAANDWTSSGLWTDLNGPVTRSDGTPAYPIVDVYNDNGDLPSANNFSITANNVGATRSPSNQYPLPMPVRWLYVLKQGQIIAPDSGSSDTKVTFSSAAPNVPTAANPIIGRIAFWTDDDTCRVNVNTASYGTFWDTPRFTAPDDFTLATNQPVGKEYQRYPGHVAMTTLSLALPELAAVPEKIIGLTPRYYTGGSTEGTVLSTQTTVALGSTGKTNRLYASVNELLFDPPTITSGTRTLSTPTATSLTKTQLEAAKFFLTAHSRGPELNLFGEPRVSIWPISSLTNSSAGSYRTATDQLIAFCSSTTGTTSGSLATNAYYFTRAPHTTALTFGTYAANLVGSNSSTADISLPRNINILNYLDALTAQALPGNLSGSTSTTFDSKYQTLGMRQILTEMFDYVRITNTSDPLLDFNTGIAYPPNNSVAKNVRYATTSAVPATPYYNTQGDGGILPSYYAPWKTYGYGRLGGLVVEATIDFVGVGAGATNSAYAARVKGYPINNPSPTNDCNPVPQAQLDTVYNDPDSPGYTGAAPSAPAATYSTALPYDNNPNATAAGKSPVGGVPPPLNTAVQAFVGLSFFDPAVGFAQSVPEYTAIITGNGLKTLQLNKTPMYFTATPNPIVTDNNPLYNGRPSNMGSTRPWTDYMHNAKFLRTGGYSLYSDIITVTNVATGTPPIPPTMILSGGGTVTVNIYPLVETATVASGVTPIHTYVLDFSKLCGFGMPIPGLSTRPLVGSIRSPATDDTTTTAAPWPDRLDSHANHSSDGNELISNITDSYHDTVVSLVPTGTYGDYRMLAPYSLAMSSSDPILQGTAYTAHPNAGFQLAYGLEYPGGALGNGAAQGKLISGATYFTPGTGYGEYNLSSTPMVPATVIGATSGSGAIIPGGPPPDFDNAFGTLPDGPYINKPDEGAQFPSGSIQYYDNIVLGQTNLASFTSPERQVPSPVMFGSLPSGAPVGSLPAKPWQTLLFQPGMTGHEGLVPPKDEYLLDLFWMPQSEPYAISEPFSTAGKVNLNYQIFPFTYIDRSTAIQSVLASEKVAMIPFNKALNYKAGSTTSNKSSTQAMSSAARFSLNMSESDGTLRQFAAKFANYDFFHAASEICDVYLVPLGTSWTSDTTAQSAFYDVSSSGQFALVGDNTREKPYADIYSRITTKSNSYTVYYRVQTLKNPSSDPTVWTEGSGPILGDFRGSTTLERYIDPNDQSVPDYAATANLPPNAPPNLENHYKWRVVENTRFAP